MKHNKQSGLPLALFGLILIIAMMILLFTNEGNYVKREKALKHIKDAVAADSYDLSISDGELILLNGDPLVELGLKDNTFQVYVNDAIKLRRHVSSYQWVELKESNEGDDTYSYELDWVEDVVDSSLFHTNIYENPESFSYDDKVFISDSIKLGHYNLSEDFIGQLNDYEPLEVLSANTSLSVFEEDSDLDPIDNKLFVSKSGSSTYDNPELGDLLITYDVVYPKTITVLGEKYQDTLVAYETNHGMLAEVSYGLKNKNALINEKADLNKSKTWAIRVAGIIGLMIAIGMIMSPIKNSVSKIPLIGKLLGAGLLLASVVIGGASGLIIIAIGWLFYKPLIATSVIGVLIAGLLLINKRQEKQVSNEI